MRKAAIAVLSSLVASVLFTVASPSSPAFAAVNPIDCANTGMLQIINTVDTSVTVNEMNVVADPVNASLTPLFTVNFTGDMVKFNGAGVNPIDNQIYGSLKHNDKAYFVRLGSDGFEYLFQWDIGHNFIADFDENGDYIYVSTGYRKVSNSHQLQGYPDKASVGAADPADTSVVINTNFSQVTGADIAIVRNDNGETISVSVQNTGGIVIHNLTTGEQRYRTRAQAGVPAGSVQWGAAYAFGDLVYASENYELGVIQIPWKSYLAGNFAAQVSEVVANSADTQFNDGANCKDVPPPAVPCGFPGLSGITADDPNCVETTTIDIVTAVPCANVTGIQHINSDGSQASTISGTSGTRPFNFLHMYNVDPANGLIQSFSPNWILDLTQYGIQEINATGINPMDDKMYGYAVMTSDASYAVVRFDNLGHLEFVHTGVGDWIFTGAFTLDGTYIIQNSTTGKAQTLAGLHNLAGWETKADLDTNFTTDNWVTTNGNQNLLIADWAVATAANGDKVAVGVTSGGHPYKVLEYNITQDSWQSATANIPDLGVNGWGAAFSYADNSVYASINGGQGLYKILWDEPLINNETQMVEVFETTSDTGYNDGASCMDQLPAFPCAYDASLTADDANCVPDTTFDVVNNMQCQKNNADRTYTITNTGDVGAEFMITNEANTNQYSGVELGPGESFTWNFDTTFTIVEDAVNDFRVDINWIDSDSVSYVIQIPTFIDNFVDCDPKAPVEWTNLPCSNDKEASFERLNKYYATALTELVDVYERPDLAAKVTEKWNTLKTATSPVGKDKSQSERIKDQCHQILSKFMRNQ